MLKAIVCEKGDDDERETERKTTTAVTDIKITFTSNLVARTKFKSLLGCLGSVCSNEQ